MTSNQEPCDILVEARWCLPADDGNSELENHAVAIRDGRIVALLPIEDARQRFNALETVRRPRHLLLPGLINAHTHSAMTLLRGYAEDLPLDRWLRERIWPAERRWVSPEWVRDGTRHAVAEMVKSGITCFSDQYFFPETVAEVAAELHVRAVVATPVIDAETAWAKNGSDCLARAADNVHDRYADHPLITTAFAPHTTEVVTDATFAALRVMADQLDCRIQIHLHESPAEIDAEIRQSGERPLARLKRLGLVNSSLLAVHSVHMTPDEISLLAASGASVAHCPRSNMKLGSGIAPIRAMLDAGIKVGLGTDGAASNNELEMLGEMRSAALLGRVRASDPTDVTATAALRMATIGGACALGLEDVVGSIEAGKQADLLCLDLHSLNCQPIHDPLSVVVFSARVDQVTDVWIAGRHQLSNGQLTQIDEESVIARSAEWQQRMARTNRGEAA